jgi:hypothetical protein
MNHSQVEEHGVERAHDSGTDGDVTIDSEKTIGEELPVEAQQEEAKGVDVPPDGGYGWVCVACVFLINAHTWGVNSVRMYKFPLIDGS